jgi:hypothetical protein
MLARELAEPRQQPALHELARHAEIEHATDPFAADAVHRAAHLVETAAHAGEQLRAFLRQRDRARMTAEQRHADVGFERLDLCADRCGRDAQFPRGGGEAEVRGHGLEHAQGIERQAFDFGRHRAGHE